MRGPITKTYYDCIQWSPFLKTTEYNPKHLTQMCDNWQVDILLKVEINKNHSSTGPLSKAVDDIKIRLKEDNWTGRWVTRLC